MMREVASHGGGMAAASSVHINLFGPHPIVVHGTRRQKERWLPPLIAGEDQCCFGFTAADAGLNAHPHQDLRREGPGSYVDHGQKGVDLHRPSSGEDHASDPDHQVRGLRPSHRRHHHLLHRPRPDPGSMSTPCPKMGRKAIPIRTPSSSMACSCPMRIVSARRAGKSLHPRQPQSRAHPHRRRGHRHRFRLRRPGGGLRPRAGGVRSADRPEPGYPASAGRKLDVSGIGLADGHARGRPLRRRRAVWGRGPTPRSSLAPAPATTLPGRRSRPMAALDTPRSITSSASTA